MTVACRLLLVAQRAFRVHVGPPVVGNCNRELAPLLWILVRMLAWE